MSEKTNALGTCLSDDTRTAEHPTRVPPSALATAERSETAEGRGMPKATQCGATRRRRDAPRPILSDAFRPSAETLPTREPPRPVPSSPRRQARPSQFPRRLDARRSPSQQPTRQHPIRPNLHFQNHANREPFTARQPLQHEDSPRQVTSAFCRIFLSRFRLKSRAPPKNRFSARGNGCPSSNRRFISSVAQIRSATCNIL